MGRRNIRLTEYEKEKAYNEVIPIAQQFRQKYLPENQKVENTFKILEEQLGYFILRFPSEDSDLSGFHIEKSGIHCIYINSCHTLGRQIFSAWHECYHAINGQVSLSFISKLDKDIEEYKAECFASCILMPERLVKLFIIQNNINLNYISHHDIIKMQHYFGVSYSAMVRRLIQLFPENKNTLQNRYALGQKSKEKELEQKTLQAGFDTALIKPTNDIYVSHKFIEDIQFNLKDGRISQEKAMSLIKLIQSLGENDAD